MIAIVKDGVDLPVAALGDELVELLTDWYGTRSEGLTQQRGLYGELPDARVGSVFWPVTGATQYAFGVLPVTGDFSAGLSAGDEVEVQLWDEDGGDRVSLPMYVLKVDAVSDCGQDPGNALSLVTVVDGRWFGWQRSGYGECASEAPASWGQLLSALCQELQYTPNIGALDGAYLTPTERWRTNAAQGTSTAALLDYACTCVGLRAVYPAERGVVLLQHGQQAHEAVESYDNALRTMSRIAGGAVDDGYALPPVARALWQDGSFSEAPTGGSGKGHVTVWHDCPARSTPGQRASLAAAWARDFGYWAIKPSIDYVVAGFVTPPRSGLVGVVEYRHTASEGFTRIAPAPAGTPPMPRWTGAGFPAEITGPIDGTAGYPWTRLALDQIVGQVEQDTAGCGSTTGYYAFALNNADDVDEGSRVWLHPTGFGGGWVFEWKDEPENPYKPPVDPPAECVRWYSLYLHMQSVIVFDGKPLAPYELIGWLGAYQTGSHLHLSIGDGDPIFVFGLPSAGQTIDVDSILGLPVNGARVGAPLRADNFTEDEKGVIASFLGFPLDETKPWEIFHGSPFHDQLEYFSVDIALPPAEDQAEAGEPVYNAINSPAVKSVVKFAGPLGPRVGYGVLVEHTYGTCDEEDDPHETADQCGISRDPQTGAPRLDLSNVVTDGLYWIDDGCTLGVIAGCGLDYGEADEDGVIPLVVDTAALAGDNQETSLVVVPGSCPSLGVDLLVAETVTHTREVVTGFGLVDGKLRLSVNRYVDTWGRNAAGVFVDLNTVGPTPIAREVDVCKFTACCDSEPPSIGAIVADPASGYAGVPVDFSLASVTGGTPPYSYYWEFGDGTTSTDAAPTHTYSEQGVYDVVVTVTDDCGHAVGDTIEYTVGSPAYSPSGLTGDCDCDVPPFLYFRFSGTLAALGVVQLVHQGGGAYTVPSGSIDVELIDGYGGYDTTTFQLSDGGSPCAYDWQILPPLGPTATNINVQAGVWGCPGCDPAPCEAFEDNLDPIAYMSSGDEALTVQLVYDVTGTTPYQGPHSNPLEGTLIYNNTYTETAETTNFNPGDVTIATLDTTTPSSGQSVFLVSKVIHGLPPFSFQWKEGGADIAGATLPTYSFSRTVETETNYAITCTVTDGDNRVVTSNTVNITVTPMP